MEKEREQDPVKVEILAFTDPYCSWCWAAEPMLLALKERYREQMRLIHVFGGMIRDMDDFYDERNNIASAEAVMPHWRDASERCGQPIDELVWKEIAEIRHFSSWPANIACKAAFLQGEEVGFRYLRKMRIGLFTERKIISNREVFRKTAEETEGLDLCEFEKSLEDGRAEKAFKEDLLLNQRLGVYQFPTLIFRRCKAEGERTGREDAVPLGGYHSTRMYEEVIRRLAPEIHSYEARGEQQLLALYGALTEREIAEMKGRNKEEEILILEELAEKGEICKLPKVRGNLWMIRGERDGGR
ncbi:MAG: DsbA family protein [Peptostreptococcaceae bacterium]|nr:DsbA family protein [Peptostreptococcaceae bacterium]